MANPNSPGNGGSGWRGRAHDESADVQHRWQSSDAETPAEKVPSDGRGRRIAFGALLLAALVLLGFYVRSLLLAPVQTPVLFLTAGPYEPPFAPNGWSREDARSLADLNGKTLSVSQARSMEEFNAQLKELLVRQKRSNVVVIAISMHGAVDESGEPCLIPPGASPLQSSTWVKLRDVLGSIRNSDLPEKTRKLLILDANRVRTCWRQGTLYNGFTDRLAEAGLVKKSGIPNLVILNSVSPGQRGWAAPELQGSVFGHYLRQGLAGAADANKDRSVSLQELHGYVRRHADHWARHHYGERQTPMLLAGQNGASGTDVDFHVAWAYRGHLPDPKPWVPAVKSDEIAVLWRYHDQARADATYRFDPLTWSTFQSKLLRLEAAASAGEAYKPAAARLHNELHELRKRLDAQRRAIRNPRSLYADLRTFTRDPEGSLPADGLPDLALAELLGGLDPQTARRIQDALQTLRKSPTSARIAAARQTIDAAPQTRQSADAHFLRMLDRYNIPALWSRQGMPASTLESRNLASQAAVPTEIRAFPGIRKSLTEADRRRRLLEDRLFAGEASAPANLGAETAAVTDLYRTEIKRADSLTAAIWLRDRVHAELPWLLAWLARPATSFNKDLKHDQIDRVVADLVRDFRQYRHAVRNEKSDNALKAKVASRLDELRAKYDAECAELVKTRNPDVFVLRRIQAALSVPLVASNETRAALTAAARDIAVQSHRKFPADAAAESTEDSSVDGDRPNARQTAVRWKRHPLQALLSDWNPADAGKADGAESSASPRLVYEVEAAIRKQLAELQVDVRELGSQQTIGPDVFRRNTAWTAERWRFALSLPLPATERDPVHFLRRFELQQLLVWQADRTLRDFWGRAGLPDPFFAGAAGRQLAAAQSVFAHFRGFEGQHQSLRDQLNRWKDPARNVFTTEATAGLKIDPSDNVPVNVSVRQTAGVSFSGGGPDATAGIASVSLWGPRDRVGTTVHPLTVLRKDADPAGRPNESKVTFSVNPMQAVAALDGAAATHPSRVAAGSSLWARTVFRGHEFSSPFKLEVAAGATSEVWPQTSDRSSVTVRGSAARPLSIVFILDCSYSMANRVRRDAARKTRHDVALAALKSMLGKLADRGNARVGVVFYGHRVAWNASKPTELLRQTDYARRFPDELLPLEDVEAVLPLGRFDDRVSKRVEGLLETLKPWGETPLYLAIDEALRQFAGETGDGERRIVVITDGVNNQRVPRDLQLTKSQAAKVTSRAALERAIRRQPVPVDILGFEMDTTEERGAQQDFRRIASQSKGSYHAAVQADSLLGTLTSLLGPAEFQLLGGDGKSLGTAGLGKTITLTVPGSGAAKWNVASGAARSGIELHGGESLQLVIGGDPGRMRRRRTIQGGDGTSIQSIRYDQGDPKFVPLIDPKTSANTGTLAGLHAASRAGDDGSDVEFTVSLQRADRSFSPRLPLVWIEVTPLSAPGRSVGKPYLFVDAAYALQMPVPVLTMRALQWPSTARLASFRVWCQPQAAGSQTVPLSKLLAGTSKSPAAARTVAVFGSMLRADVHAEKGRLVLRIVQRTDSGAGRFQPLKIDVAGLSPQRIVRQFDADHGVALHRFEFEPGQEPLLNSAELRIMTRAAAVRDAWQFTKPTTIDVRARGELLPLIVPPRSRN